MSFIAKTGTTVLFLPELRPKITLKAEVPLSTLFHHFLLGTSGNLVQEPESKADDYLSIYLSTQFPHVVLPGEENKQTRKLQRWILRTSTIFFFLPLVTYCRKPSLYSLH